MSWKEVNEMNDQYLFIGVGVALSVLGFFMKRIKEEVDIMKHKTARLEINLARNHEKILNLEKIAEDRRQDIQKLFANREHNPR